ncbi:hypothetical protein COBT_002537 [Conglomerata obtusa]
MFAKEQYIDAFNLKTREIMQKKLCLHCLMPYKPVKDKENCLKCNKGKCIALKSTNSIFLKKPFFNSKTKNLQNSRCTVPIFIGINSKQINTLTMINNVTITKLIKNSLKLIKKFVSLNQRILGGNDVIVEGDKSLFGRRKYNLGRQRNQTWVVGFVEKTPE